MEQDNQKINQKSTLPIKTKIVAWLLIIFGIISLCYQILILYPSYKLGGEYGFGFPFFGALFPVLFNALIFLLPGIFLIKKKKVAWNFAVVILVFIIIGGLFSLGISVFQEDYNFADKKLAAIFYFLLVFLFILLLLDRKNFWKVAT